MEVIKLQKVRRFNLNGFSFTDYFSILSFSPPFVRSKVSGALLQNHHYGW